MSRLVALIAAVVMLLPFAATADPLDEILSQSPVDVPGCDNLDTTRCLLPWPSDTFTVADESTPTGLRIDFPVHAMPRNIAGKPIDPTEWNRNDGFSPGTTVMTLVSGIDMQATFGVDNTIVDPTLTSEKDSPLLVVDAETGTPHPMWAELDTHADTAPEDRLLIGRPLRNFDNATRYLVVLRDLSDGSGTIPAPAESDPAIVEELQGLEIDTEGLYLAWDFTVASGQNLTGRATAIRNDAFAALGDPMPQDTIIDGDTPTFTIQSVSDRDPDDAEDGNRLKRFRRIEGTMSVPNYLTLPQGTRVPPELPDEVSANLPAEFADGYGSAAEVGQHVPGSRLYYGSPTPGPMDTPVVNPAASTFEVPFTCVLPHPDLQGGEPAIGMVYGHGLLGSRGEMTGSSADRMRERGYGTCAMNWVGMSTPDLANVVTILADMSNFPSLADRAQQGFLNMSFLARAMAHPEGFAADPAFQLDGASLLHTAESAAEAGIPAVVYDGNSQGGIMGGALAAVSPDINRATLGVVGMNYSTLLNRSVDWEGKQAFDPTSGDIPAYAEIAYSFYPDKIDQQVLFQVMQMLWDRAENNGYANQLTTGTSDIPANQILLHPAYGDYQVANISAEVMARTIDAAFEESALEEGLHWADDAGQRLFGFDAMGDGVEGSALVYWDSGNSAPPNGNVPPDFQDLDPHEHPRRDERSGDQRDVFYRTGVVQDVYAGGPYHTYVYEQKVANGEPLRTEDNGHD